MPDKPRINAPSLRLLATAVAPFVLLAAVLLLLAYLWLDPTPPQARGAGHRRRAGRVREFGKRYAALLAQHGIKVELRNTQGAAENLALLRDANSGVDVAFVQGGADATAHGRRAGPTTGLLSLGSLFYEPVWLFYREDARRSGC